MSKVDPFPGRLTLVQIAILLAFFILRKTEGWFLQISKLVLKFVFVYMLLNVFAEHI